MSLKFFQSIVNKASEAIDSEFGILDTTGRILASTKQSKIDKVIDIPLKKLNDIHDIVEHEDMMYKAIYKKNKVDLVAYIQNNTENNKSMLNFFSIHISSMKLYYDEKYDKYSFVKNVLLENLLPADIPIKAKELGISNSVKRFVLFLRCKDLEINSKIYNEVCDLYSDRPSDFIILIEEQGVSLIMEVKTEYSDKDISKISDTIIEGLNKDKLDVIKMGIGSVVDDVKDIGKSFKEAQMASIVGEIFNKDQLITNYNSLGLGRLIYHMPKTLCKLFLNEVFEENFFDSLDVETLFTVNKFFENNLNVSETSRQLFVHRNTLVYRLDKIQKNTGLDLRMFDHAIIFKVALMVRSYLENS